MYPEIGDNFIQCYADFYRFRTFFKDFLIVSLDFMHVSEKASIKRFYLTINFSLNMEISNFFKPKQLEETLSQVQRF